MAMPPDSNDPPAEGVPAEGVPAGDVPAEGVPDAADAPSPPPPSTWSPPPPTREYRAQWTFIIATAFLAFAYVVILTRGGGGGGLFLAGALGIGGCELRTVAATNAL